MREVIPPNAKLLPPNAKLVFKGQIYDVYQWDQKMFDGSIGIFEMLKRPDTVKALLIKDGKIVIVEEEQPYHGKFFDIPGGRHDVDSETELQAIQREVLEETGMSFNSWRLLKVSQPHTKTDHLSYLFLATDFKSQSEPKLDAGEKIIVHLKALDEVKTMFDLPSTRHLPWETLKNVQSIEELETLPAYTPSS